MAKKKAKKNPIKKTNSATKKASKKTISAPKSGLQPLHDRIIIRPLSEEEAGTRSPSGIIIPDTVSKEKPEQGIVVATGPGRIGDDNERIPVSVEVGDRVVFSKYGFDEVKVGGKEFYIVSESSILAVLND